MRFLAHPLWLAGFRPFFILACLAGVVLPLAWAAVYLGLLPAPASRLDALAWHAHEMFFGFGWAVLGGFLLTASKNWVGIRGYHGVALAGPAAAWLLERWALAAGAGWPDWLYWPAAYAFLATLAGMLTWTLLRHRATDSYRDNLIFVVMLPTFLLAKSLLLAGDLASGAGLALALFRLAFLVMLERTLSQFMKAACQVTILRQPRLDLPIKLLGLALLGTPWLPPAALAGLELLLAALLVGRLPFWYPLRALRRIELGIMYVGYLAIVGQLGLDAWQQIYGAAWVGSAALHLFTFGAMGCVIPAMLLRIARGHTGRPVAFDPLDRKLLWLTLAALACRVLLPQLLPAAYADWIGLAALLWAAVFAVLGWRIVPLLWRPRVDGREH